MRSKEEVLMWATKDAKTVSLHPDGKTRATVTHYDEETAEVIAKAMRVYEIVQMGAFNGDKPLTFEEILTEADRL